MQDSFILSESNVYTNYDNTEFLLLIALSISIIVLYRNESFMDSGLF